MADAQLEQWESDFEEAIESIVEQEKMAAQDAAIFFRHETTGLHCQLVLYFAPGLFDWSLKKGASPCKEPSRSGLAVLVGKTEKS